MTDQELVPMGPGREDEELATGEALPKLDVEITPEIVEAESDDEELSQGKGASVADLEALLFVAERPLSRAELRSVARLSEEEVDARLGDLEVQLSDRGIRLVGSGDRVMLGTSPESGALIARYLGADTVRLSPAALETLAIIAYRQPVTRGVIERIRGVDSGHVARGLLHRRLIVEQGRAETPGRPILYGTNMEFMERFGLTSLDDLPPLEAEIAAQLAQAEEEAKAESEPADEGDEATAGPGSQDDAADDETADHDAADDDGSSEAGASSEESEPQAEPDAAEAPRSDA
jgi:segregation and condensation protein B